MKVVIIGGHLTPALSVIEELPPGAEILYVGRKYALEGDSAISLEYETIAKKGINFIPLKTGRLQRKLTRHSLPSLSRVPLGFVASLSILRNFKPDVVVGFGGYVSFPVILAAHLLKIPIVIHEQTLGAGGTNKLVARFADKICISFESSKKYFPKEKIVLTGNPIRKTILNPVKSLKIDKSNPVLFITGGSLGSHAINILVEKTLNRLLDRYFVVHLTGSATEFKDFEKLSILKEGLNNSKRDNYIVAKHFLPEEIGYALKEADLVVGRAGINTISELIVLDKPAFLIPLPNSQDNEQLNNALFLKNLGLGEVGNQVTMNPEEFFSEINNMTENIKNYKLKSKRSHFPPDAAKKIVEVIYAAHKSSN